jgi:hypothetical protein
MTFEPRLICEPLEILLHCRNLERAYYGSVFRLKEFPGARAELIGLHWIWISRRLYLRIRYTHLLQQRGEHSFEQFSSTPPRRKYRVRDRN